MGAAKADLRVVAWLLVKLEGGCSPGTCLPAWVHTRALVLRVGA